jgi:TolA-binding protein
MEKNFLTVLVCLTLVIPALSQSTKEKLGMVIEQNRSLQERFNALSSKVEMQDKIILSLESKVNYLEKRIQDLESSKDTRLQAIPPPSQAKPLMNNSENSKPENREQPKSYGQCKATTQKGTRCSRQGGPTGYCWQHAK